MMAHEFVELDDELPVSTVCLTEALKVISRFHIDHYVYRHWLVARSDITVHLDGHLAGHSHSHRADLG